MKPHFCPSLLAAPMLLVCLLPVNLKAQEITGTLDAYTHTAYAGIAAHFRIDDLEVDGTPFLGGVGNIFCSDLDATSLDEDSQLYPRPVTLTLGTIQEIDVWDQYSTPQDEALATAQVSWLIDNYYSSHFLNPGANADAKQYALQNVIWEIMGDGGTAAGLDFGTGNINRSKFSNSSRYGTILWTVMNDMLDAVDNSGVDGSYVATREIYAALDSRAGYQDYFLLANEVTVVPEPNTAGIGAFGMVLVLAKRRRKAVG